MTYEHIHKSLEEIRNRDSALIKDVNVKIDSLKKDVTTYGQDEAARKLLLSELSESTNESTDKVIRELATVKAQLLKMENPIMQDIDYDKVKELIAGEFKKLEKPPQDQRGESGATTKDPKYLIAWNNRTLKVRNSQIKAYEGDLCRLFKELSHESRAVSKEAGEFTKANHVLVKCFRKWEEVSEEKLLETKGDLFPIVHSFRANRGNKKKPSNTETKKPGQNQGPRGPKSRGNQNKQLDQKTLKNFFTQILRVDGRPANGKK